jgi:hypothetical protein
MVKWGHMKYVSKAAVHKMVRDLQKQTSPMVICASLEMLTNSLNDKAMGEKVAIMFVRAGGLPSLIRHLGGAPTSTRTVYMRTRTSNEATRAFGTLIGLCNDALLAEMQLATGVIMPLVDALRDAPLLSRTAAATGLMLIAHAQPTQRKAMAEAGVLGLLLTLSVDHGDDHLAENSASALSTFACMLLESGSFAAREVENALRGPETIRCFAALVLLHVCPWFF